MTHIFEVLFQTNVFAPVQAPIEATTWTPIQEKPSACAEGWIFLQQT